MRRWCARVPGALGSQRRVTNSSWLKSVLTRVVTAATAAGLRLAAGGRAPDLRSLAASVGCER